MDIKVALARAAHQAFTIENATLEAPRPDEVLIKIAGVGLCHTDLVARDQFIPIPLPAVLGHEGAGIVERVGDAVTKVKPGDRVVLSFASCGVCGKCHDHLPAYCQEFPARNFLGTRLDGSSGVGVEGQAVSAHFFGQSSFATHALAFERNVVKIADTDLPLELLGPLGCGLQTGAGAVMNSFACPAGSSIVIFGGGPVGLAAVMGAKIRACGTIILVEPVKARRQLGLELGAHHVISPAECDVAEAIRAIVPAGADFALESSGLEAVVATALSVLGSRGLLGLVGVPPKPDSAVSVNLASLITFGHRIHGIIEGDSDPDIFIPELIAHIKAGRFPIQKLIKTYALDEINQAVEEQLRGDCIKAVLIP
ncbi:MAG: NAD(P)-dependent alcohol dehydrogenase [Pseudomonadota bacterium]